MNDSSGGQLPRTGARAFLATVWPTASPTDSELQRRTKLAVRSGQLAMVAMIVAAVVGTIAGNFQQLPLPHIAGLVLVALAYVAWSLHGMHDAVRLVLWERDTAPPPAWSPRAPLGVGLYFTIQLSLAGLTYFLGDQGRIPTLLWLVLLPPVAHSVILLRRPGIAVVSLLSMAILIVNVVRWH